METTPEAINQTPPPKNRKGKLNGILDSAHLVKMIEVQHRTYEDIAQQYGVTKQAIALKYQNIRKLFDSEKINSYESSKATILSGIEAELLNDILDTAKREKASLNNAAYALNTIAMLNKLARGESTSNQQMIVLQVPRSEQEYKKIMENARQSGNEDASEPPQNP